MTEQVDILLSRYFSGEATEQELRRLDDWLAESEEHEAYFDELTRLYQQTAMVPPTPGFDVAAAWDGFKQHMEAGEGVQKKRSVRLRPVLRMVAAASVALLLGVSAFYILSREVPSAGEELQWVADGQEKRVELFEDAAVVLAPHSSVARVGDKKNELTLTGKATFTVASRQETKLLVRAGDTYVQDVGTIFTVTAPRPGEPVVVEVQEGEVLFYTATNKGVSVKQGETGVYCPQTEQFSFEEAAADEIVFSNVALWEAVGVLSARYGVDIEIADASSADMPISASFDANESLDVILDVLAETLGLEVLATGNGYTIL